MESALKITLFLDKRELGIKQPNGTYGTKNHKDFFITVHFEKTSRLVEDYVHMYMDPFRTSMPRQLLNPYFIELGFFETVTSFSGNTDGNVNHNIATKAPIYRIEINK